MPVSYKNVRAYIQVDDKVFEITGDVSSFNVTQEAINVTSFRDDAPQYIKGLTHATLEINGSASWTIAESLFSENKKSEWKCDFCGHINPMTARNCGASDKHVAGCGARRSFLLDA